MAGSQQAVENRVGARPSHGGSTRRSRHDLRLDEDGRRVSSNAVQGKTPDATRRVPHRGCIQPDPDDSAAAGNGVAHVAAQDSCRPVPLQLRGGRQSQKFNSLLAVQLARAFCAPVEQAAPGKLPMSRLRPRTPPYQFLMDRRLERAREAVERRTEPLGAIAVRLGFADRSHLTRLFRRKYGITPAAMRR